MVFGGQDVTPRENAFFFWFPPLFALRSTIDFFKFLFHLASQDRVLLPSFIPVRHDHHFLFPAP